MTTRRNFIQGAIGVFSALIAGKEVIAKVKPKKKVYHPKRYYPANLNNLPEDLRKAYLYGEWDNFDIVTRCGRYPGTDRIVVNIGYNSDLRKYKKRMIEKHPGMIVTGGKSPCFDTNRHSIFSFPNGSTLHFVTIYKLEDVYKLAGMEYQEIERMGVGAFSPHISDDDYVTINKHLDCILRGEHEDSNGYLMTKIDRVWKQIPGYKADVKSRRK